MANSSSYKQPRTTSLRETEITKDLARPGTFPPEWLRIPDVTRAFGIGRSSLYELLSEGKIKSASLRKRGNVRGIRLISVASIQTYLESVAEGGLPTKTTARE